MTFPSTNFIPFDTVITAEWMQAVNDRLQPATDVGDVAMKPVLASLSGASSIGAQPAGAIVSFTVQGALNELDTKKQAVAGKDASGGYAGLTLFKLNLRNTANTITSWFTTPATVARTWTMPDKDGTVAMTSDLGGTNSGTNTGDQIASTVPNTPAGGILSTNVQAALNELDSKKQSVLGYAAESSANKATSFSVVNDTLYPSVLAVKTYADGLLTGLWDDRGVYNASTNTYPTSGGSGASGAVLRGDIWTVNVSGTLSGIAVVPGDTLRALIDAPAQVAENWAVLANNFGYVPENVVNKDASGGYAGLTLFKLNLKNAAGTITSWFTTVATAARTWAMPDKDGIVAMTSDITGINSGTNTGDQTAGTVAFTTTGVIAATNVQAAVEEVYAETVHTTGDQTIAGIKTFTGNISAANLSGTNTGDQTASTVSFTPTGTIAATTVQAAIAEVAAEAAITGASGTFITADATAKTVTVVNGIITSIV